ncbi:jg9859 [Pararge aegeria aegeria]|uniref:Jg9859 protein n=1 Tax=Pararge aegeria aegeria TaxID=348720 RepID=A0A8S4REM5_9NEOP|nr:jg9859 [Pararge aegeria aegeria]
MPGRPTTKLAFCWLLAPRPFEGSGQQCARLNTNQLRYDKSCLGSYCVQNSCIRYGVINKDVNIYGWTALFREFLREAYLKIKNNWENKRWRNAKAGGGKAKGPAASRKPFKAIEALQARDAVLPLFRESTCALIVCGKGSSSIVSEFVWSAKKYI